jgi:hypothetical protein
MAYRFIDITVVVFLIIIAIFGLISCTIPEWSRRERDVDLKGDVIVVVDRIGLWRTCVTIDGEKTCDDTLKDKDVGCTALINATRTLNILFITLAVLGSVTLLLASATEKRWIGLVTTFIIIFTMGTGLACWACWLSYASQESCGMDDTYLAGAFILMCVAFGFSLLFTVLAVFLAISTKGFGHDKDWSGSAYLAEKYNQANAHLHHHHHPDQNRQPPPPVPPSSQRHSAPPPEAPPSSVPDRSSVYRVGDDYDNKPPSSPGDPGIASQQAGPGYAPSSMGYAPPSMSAPGYSNPGVSGGFGAPQPPPPPPPPGYSSPGFAQGVAMDPFTGQPAM